MTYWIHINKKLILLGIFNAHESQYQIWGLVFSGFYNRLDDGGSKELQNVDKILPDYAALQPRDGIFLTVRCKNPKFRKSVAVCWTTLL